MNERDYGLVVGIDHYPRYKPLLGAIADAHEVRSWLLHPEAGGALPESHVKLVTSADKPPRPLQMEIDESLQEIFDSATRTGGRRLYFYFAGHGFANRSSDVALCLAPWSRTFRNLAISAAQYRDAIADHGIFSEVIVWLDCCRTREVAAGGLPPTNPRPAPAAQAGQTRFFVAYATELFQQAMEGPVDGPLEEERLVRGHFTRALLSALWGGASRGGGGVLAQDLKEYIERETQLIAAEAGHEQRPHVSNELAGESRFGAASPEGEVDIRINPERTGEVVLEGPGLEILRRGPASSAPWVLRLRPGLHVLREPDRGASKVFSFRPSQERQRVHF